MTKATKWVVFQLLSMWSKSKCQ